VIDITALRFKRPFDVTVVKSHLDGRVKNLKNSPAE
jgi:hypothetical protein